VPIIAAAAGVIAAAAIVWVWPSHESPAPDVKPVAVQAPASRPVASAVAVPASKPPDITPRATVETPRAPATDVTRPTVADPPRDKPRLPAAAESRPPATRPRATTEPNPARATPPIVASRPPLSAPPEAAAPVAPRTDTTKLRVEVIVYSEQRPQRWVFISGRKYVEGDMIGDGARVEEIQPASVVLVENGRRVTLRP
jgi:hypothetical protein